MYLYITVVFLLVSIASFVIVVAYEKYIKVKYTQIKDKDKEEV